MNVVELLDEIDCFLQSVIRDYIDKTGLWSTAGFVFHYLWKNTPFKEVELESIDEENNKIVFSIRFEKDGKKKTLKLEVEVKATPKITVYYD